MTDETVEALILDLLEWIGPHPRPYLEVLEAWTSSCPRLPVWEEANERGFVMRRFESGVQRVAVTPAGLSFLREHRAPLMPRTATSD